jgi:ferrochelatase
MFRFLLRALLVGIILQTRPKNRRQLMLKYGGTKVLTCSDIKRMHAKVKQLVNVPVSLATLQELSFIRVTKLHEGVTEVMLFLCIRNMRWRLQLLILELAEEHRKSISQK